MSDIEFLKEILDHIDSGLNKNDPTEIQYAKKMVEDWIDELTDSKQSVDHSG